MIEVSCLTKRFDGKTALRGLDFRAVAGEFVALLGPNGAGKTTLLYILASLLRPTKGEVRVAGCPLPHHAAAARRSVGFVAHQPLLYPDLTARENLTFFGRLYAVPHLPQRVDEVLCLVGLMECGNNLVRTFSRGMLQRLAIGRAVLHDPQILLLDEPYTGLDQAACEMLDAMLHLQAMQGRVLVMASHDLGHAARLASRFDILVSGNLKVSVFREQIPAEGLSALYQQAVQSQ
ncbi:MAG: heme ABC exporter ATP-binding protein CcmA [Anaerolineae bacterium]|nr:heme ABC exporter ATP-binding protein CcmA [Anaerolineae bacterium]